MNREPIAREATQITDLGEMHLSGVSRESALQHALFDVSSVSAPNAHDENTSGPTMRSLDSLRPHPALLKQKLVPEEERLSLLDKLGELIFEQPLLITSDNIIVDGYARWIIARRQGRVTLSCIASDLSEQEALQRILQSQTRRKRISDYCRILLALELEPWFREQAHTHQSAGGREKASSKLTEDQRLDCRQQVAKVAGVSTGNVTKVKQINAEAIPDVIEALRLREISIHGAWTLRKLSNNEQSFALKNRRIKKRTSARIRRLLSKHTSKTDGLAESLRHVVLGLTGLKTVPSMSTQWEQIDTCIRIIDYGLCPKGSDAHASQADA